MLQTRTRSAGGIFAIEESGDTIVVLPTKDLRELDYGRIDRGAMDIFDLLSQDEIKHIVVDLQKSDYSGSSALAFFVKLWETIDKVNGRMAFCNVSDHEKDILRVTYLDQLWPICSSRSEALDAVRR